MRKTHTQLQQIYSAWHMYKNILAFEISQNATLKFAQTFKVTGVIATVCLFFNLSNYATSYTHIIGNV